MHQNQHNLHGAHQHNGKMSYLENPARKAELSPEKLLNIIPMKATDTILDFGAGTGYFTISAAKTVSGKVYALDVDAEMLEIIKAKALQENIGNIIPVLSDGQNLALPEGSIDLVIASLVLHEIHPLHHALIRIKNVLKENGHLICVELEPKGQPSQKAPRISSSGMEKELHGAGFRIVDKIFVSESLYILIAQKHG